MQITSTTRSDKPANIGEQQSQQNGNYTSTLTYMYDVSAASNAQAIDSDLWDAIMSVKNSDLGGYQQTLMIDLMLALKTIRQQSLEVWQTEAINAFESGLRAAVFQEQAATRNAIAGGLSASAGAVSAAVSLGSAAKGMADAKAGNAEIVADADGMDWNKPAATTPGVDAPIPNTPPPPYSAENKLVDVNGEEIEMGDLPAQSKGKDPDAATAPEQDINARAQYIADRQKSMYAQIQLEGQVASSVGELIAAFIKGGGAAAEGLAGQAQAEATVAQAIQRLLESQSEHNKSYAQEIQQSIATVLDYVKSAEQARHQAASSIANIA